MSSVAPQPAIEPVALNGIPGDGAFIPPNASRARLVERLAAMGPAAPAALQDGEPLLPAPVLPYAVCEAAALVMLQASMPPLPPEPVTGARIEIPEPVASESEPAPAKPEARLVTLIREQRALLDRLATSAERNGIAFEGAATLAPEPTRALSPDEIVRALAGAAQGAEPMPAAAPRIAEPMPPAPHRFAFGLIDGEPPPMIIERARAARDRTGPVETAAAAPRSLPAFLAGVGLSVVLGGALFLLLRKA